MKRNCQGVRCYMSLSMENILQYHTRTYHSNALSRHWHAIHASLWAPLVRAWWENMETLSVINSPSAIAIRAELELCLWPYTTQLPSHPITSGFFFGSFESTLLHFFLFIQVCFMKSTCLCNYEWQYLDWLITKMLSHENRLPFPSSFSIFITF